MGAEYVYSIQLCRIAKPFLNVLMPAFSKVALLLLVQLLIVEKRELSGAVVLTVDSYLRYYQVRHI